jgi:hypothetical protein
VLHGLARSEGLHHSWLHNADQAIAYVQGPIVSSAIIDASPSGNNSLPFYFLFGLSILGSAILAFVDLKKSRVEQATYLEKERALQEEKQKRV